MRLKEQCKATIKESRDHTAHKKLFEFFDDHSYCGAENISFHIENIAEKTYLYACMDKGPTDCDIMNKFFEWRISGKSAEIGHQGGGNKRFLYGHKSNNTELISKNTDSTLLYSSTNPNLIFELSQDDNLCENDFREQVDKEPYIKWASEISIDMAPKWYNNYIHRSDIPFVPNFIVKMDLSDLENEYSSLNAWVSFVNKIRMKNYKPNVFMKNDMMKKMDDTNTFHNTLNNIDTLGFYSDNGEDSMLELEVYIDKENNMFVEYNDNFYTKYERKGKHNPKPYSFAEKIYFGKIYQFLIDETYLKDNIAILNKDSNDSFREGDFYGIWMLINKKQIDCLPMTSIQLPDAKNNKIDGNGSTKFRWIIEPKASDKIIERIIRTDTIKANTYFKDTYKIKELIRTSMNIYKEVKNKPKEKTQECPEGAGYLLYIHKSNGEMLLKYGYVVDYKKIYARLNQHRHKKEYRKMVNQFLNINLSTDLDISDSIKFLYNTPPINEPSSFENVFHEFLTENIKEHPDKLTLFSSGRTTKEDREYFKCNNFDFLQEYIINPIASYYNGGVCL